MKHFFTFALTGCMLSATASAASQSLFIDRAELKASSLSELRNNENLRKSRTPRLSAAAPGEIITDDVISSINGFIFPYEQVSSGFYVGYDITFFEDMVSDSSIGMDYDGNYYLKDLIWGMPFGSYVKASFNEEGQLVVPLPQTVYAESDPDYGDTWIDVNMFYSPDLTTELPEVVDGEWQLVFDISEDGSLTMAPLPEGYAAGLEMIEDGFAMWMGFAATNITYREPQGQGMVTPPDDLVTTEYSYITRGYNSDPSLPDDFGLHVQVGFDGDDVYFGGWSYDYPQVWIRGHRDGNLVTIPYQFFGQSSVYVFNIMFAKYDDSALGGMSLLPDDTEFVMEYNEEAGTFTTLTKDVVMLINGATDRILALQMYENPSLLYQPDASGAPLAPHSLVYDDRYFDAYGFAYFDFNLPMLNDEGVLLYKENMFYNLYIDGEITEILDEDFSCGADMWDIPYSFDRNLIVSSIFNTDHEMGIKVTGFDTIGLQAFNVWDDVRYYSPLVTLDINTGEITTEPGTVGVNQPAVKAEVVNEEYFDLAGRRMTAPNNGIFIRRTTDINGNISVSKAVRR
ncbi:MAG: hypothetical protein K2J92_02145 [Muribaculaceae bacterium]|nr:hypothetical protein [Muribaculaceae bacterium]